MIVDVKDTKCPFGGDFICVEGYRYRRLGDGDELEAPEHLISKDLPGLLFVGKCDCCVKVTGGVK